MINKNKSNLLAEGGQDVDDHQKMAADIRKSVKVIPPQEDSADRLESLRHSNIDLDMNGLRSKSEKYHANDHDSPKENNLE